MTRLEIYNKIKSAKEAKEFVKGMDGIADQEEINAYTSLMDIYIDNLRKDLKEEEKYLDTIIECKWCGRRFERRNGIILDHCPLCGNEKLGPISDEERNTLVLDEKYIKRILANIHDVDPNAVSLVADSDGRRYTFFARIKLNEM